MKCPKCQFDNPSDAKFCNECGSKLELVCTQCSKSNTPGSKFCNACGHNLNGSGRPPALDYAEPQSYTPKFLADKILTTRSSIEGERKLVTVLFAELPTIPPWLKSLIRKSFTKLWTAVSTF
jgi:hypothetical protein